MIEYVTKVLIDWKKDTIIPPSIIIFLKVFPPLDHFLFENKNDIYAAEYSGFVIGYAKNSNSNKCLSLTMLNGEKETVMVDDECEDLHINIQHDIKCKSVTFVINDCKYAGFITLTFLEEILEKFHPYAHIVNRSPIKFYDKKDTVFNIALKNNVCTNPYHDGTFKNYKCSSCQHFDW